MPRRVVLELMQQVLGVPLSLGSVQNSWEETSEAVAEPCAELQRQLPNEPVLNADETGYRTSGEKRWLWAFVAPGFVFYKIALSRGTEVLVQLLGAAFAGILCSDRCPTYLKYHPGEGQFCWAHFKRNILGVLDIAKRPRRNDSAAMFSPCTRACSVSGIGFVPVRVSAMDRSQGSS
jgi:transposase